VVENSKASLKQELLFKILPFRQKSNFETKKGMARFAGQL